LVPLPLNGFDVFRRGGEAEYLAGGGAGGVFVLGSLSRGGGAALEAAPP
jgi:translation initiation factor 2 gamma subunit (eIF-2gamma)